MAEKLTEAGKGVVHGPMGLNAIPMSIDRQMFPAGAEIIVMRPGELKPVEKFLVESGSMALWVGPNTADMIRSQIKPDKAS